MQLHKEIYFMEERLREGDRERGYFPEPPRPSVTRFPTLPSGARRSLQLTPRREASLSRGAAAPGEKTSQGQLRQRGQFDRYFIERQERDRILKNKTHVGNTSLDSSIKDILEGIQGLRQIHQQYLASLGVDTVCEIPNLIPQKKKSKSEDDLKDDLEDGVGDNSGDDLKEDSGDDLRDE